MFVSVIIPNLNHLRFIKNRINSILNQTYLDFELIILDDCSIDGSWEYLKQYENHPKVSYCIRNDTNSGSPFRQWKKGIELSKGELIWIAESDDWSEISFLEKSVPCFESVEVGMVLAASTFVDVNDQVLGEVPINYSLGCHSGIDFVKSYMYFQNQILNASAVIFRKSFINHSILDRIGQFRLSGDHLFWSSLMKECNVVVLSDYLNFFRWHDQSVRNQELKKLTGLKEGIKIKLYLEEQFEIDRKDKTKARREAYLNYFKFLNHNPSPKNWDEFMEVLYFFSSMDKLKVWIRFVLFS